MSVKLGDVLITQPKPSESPPSPSGKKLPKWMRPTGVVKSALMLEKMKKRRNRRKKKTRKARRLAHRH